MDLQKAPGRQPHTPDVPAQSTVEQGQVLSLGPSLLRLLSQVRQGAWGSGSCCSCSAGLAYQNPPVLPSSALSTWTRSMSWSCTWQRLNLCGMSRSQGPGSCWTAMADGESCQEAASVWHPISMLGATWAESKPLIGAGSGMGHRTVSEIFLAMRNLLSTHLGPLPFCPW